MEWDRAHGRKGRRGERMKEGKTRRKEKERRV